MAYSPEVFDSTAYEVVETGVVQVTTADSSYWIPLKCLVEVYDNTGNTLLLSYNMFDPESNLVKLLECNVSLGLTNTQFRIMFEDGDHVIDQNAIGLGNKVLVYAGREHTDLTLLFTGYSEERTPIILGGNVMNYEMAGFGENASLNDLIVNFKRASSTLTDIKDPNFPKRPDSDMVVHELVRDLFEDPDVRVTRDIILKDYLNLDISGISPLVTERLLSVVQNLQEVSQVLNFLTEVTGAYWNIENGKLYFEYPEVKHSGIVIKNTVSTADLAASTSYFLGSWRYTDSISKENGFANRIYTTTATDTKSVANAMSNQGATSLFDRAIAVQVPLMETRLNTLAFIMSKIGDPFVQLEEEVFRGGYASNPEPPPPQCPTGYHKDPVTNQCVPDEPPEEYICPQGWHWDTNTQTCVPDDPGDGGTDEGAIDTYGIKWLVARGDQFNVVHSRHAQETNGEIDDRWSGNITGLRNGFEATFIGKSIGCGGGAHFAMKQGGGNHSCGDCDQYRWYDTGIRADGSVTLEWEGPHPSNHDFSIPDSKFFIRDIGVELEDNWIGLKWCVQALIPNTGSPENGGVRCRMWVDTDPLNLTTVRPNNNWRLVYDFIDGIDVEAIEPQDYEMPDEQDCEVRRSGTERHDVYALGTIIEDSQEGDPGGLHVRRLGQTSTTPPEPPPPVCPTNYHWDATLKRCIRDTPPPPQCPTGQHWDTTLQRCVPDTPPPTGELLFNISGDFRSGDEAVATGNNLVSNDPDLVLMTGDYAVGDASNDEWCHEIMSMVDTHRAQVWGCEGNHDNDGYLDVNFFENTAWEWTHKQNGIAFIGCNTISEDVEDADTRCAEAFADPDIHTIICLMHEGIWHPVGTSVSSDTTIEFHETFLKYKPKLKMVVCGHTHVYGRMKPVDGILYVMNGIGGQSPTSGSTTPSPFHKINGMLSCRLNSDRSIHCESVPNAGDAPAIMDTFTIGADGTLPTDGVNVRSRSFMPQLPPNPPPPPFSFGALPPPLPPAHIPAMIINNETDRLKANPDRIVGFPCDASDIDAPKKKVTRTISQKHEGEGYYIGTVENKTVQSASQLEEQVVHGEIRIDNNNTPNGPVITQFKVPVGGLSSTADTIFVNDVKVDASVLSPNGKYWLVMLPCGTSPRNTVLWHHDADLSTFGKYSAFAKGETKNDLSEWHVSRYGPTYTHAVFARLRRIQEYSDPQSIQRFRLKEDIAQADFLDDSLSVAKMMQNVLAYRGKPVRKYTLNEVTLPAGKWFTPGQNVTIVDSTGYHEEGKNIFAEIQEVSYSWSTSSAEDTVGTFRVNVLPVGHLNWHKELFPAGD